MKLHTGMYDPKGWLMAGIMATILLVGIGLAHSADVTLQWNSVAEADKYKVYHGTASGTYLIPEETTQTTHTLTLGPGTYYFAVKASNIYGDSEYSEEVGPTTIAEHIPPAEDEELPPACTAKPGVSRVEIYSRVIPDGRTQTITSVYSGNDPVSKTYTYSVAP